MTGNDVTLLNNDDITLDALRSSVSQQPGYNSVVGYNSVANPIPFVHHTANGREDKGENTEERNTATQNREETAPPKSSGREGSYNTLPTTIPGYNTPDNTATVDNNDDKAVDNNVEPLEAVDWTEFEDPDFVHSVNASLQRRNEFVQHQCEELERAGTKLRQVPIQFRNFGDLKLGESYLFFQRTR